MRYTHWIRNQNSPTHRSNSGSFVVLYIGYRPLFSDLLLSSSESVLPTFNDPGSLHVNCHVLGHSRFRRNYLNWISNHLDRVCATRQALHRNYILTCFPQKYSIQKENKCNSSTQKNTFLTLHFFVFSFFSSNVNL